MSSARMFVLPNLTVAQAGAIISAKIKADAELSIVRHLEAIEKLKLKLTEPPYEYKNPDAPCTIGQVVMGRRLKLGEFNPDGE